MAESLLEQNTPAFEIFVLSDTTRPELYVKETAAYHVLREKLGDRMRVWYRRRSDNVGRKVGNLHDFVTRWGGRYDFMVVLDADSILAPETLVTLVREMAADPNLGLLQTVPRLAGGRTLYARLQQFSGRVYGPIVARGIASWQGDDGNYWGHNAIVRVGSDGLYRLVAAALRVADHRRVVVANRGPVSGQQFEQAIGGGLTVERFDRRSECLGVGDDLGFGDFALCLVTRLRGEHVAADPEDVLDPQITQRHLRLKDGDRISRFSGRCGERWSGKAEARQQQQRSGEQLEPYVSRHLFALPR